MRPLAKLCVQDAGRTPKKITAICCYEFFSVLPYSIFFAGIEEQVRNIQAKKQALKENIGEEPEKQRVGLGAGGHFDTDIYGSTRSKFEGYHTYIAPNEDAEVSYD